LREHELGDHDTDTINADVVAALTADAGDCGARFSSTPSGSASGSTRSTSTPPTAGSVAQRVDALWSRIEASPKSRRWRLRARVGERKRWYEVPDEA
jgi:hypothetical protein